MVLFIMNITLNVSDIINISNITRIDTITPYRYCVTPDYNAVLLGIVILLSIPYLFKLNKRLAKIFRIEPLKDTDSQGIRWFKRVFSDEFYVGNAFFLALLFYLYNVFFA